MNLDNVRFENNAIVNYTKVVDQGVSKLLKR